MAHVTNRLVNRVFHTAVPSAAEAESNYVLTRQPSRSSLSGCLPRGTSQTQHIPLSTSWRNVRSRILCKVAERDGEESIPIAAAQTPPEVHVARAQLYKRQRVLLLPMAVWEALRLIPGGQVAIRIIGEKAILERVPLENLAKLRTGNPLATEMAR